MNKQALIDLILQTTATFVDYPFNRAGQQANTLLTVLKQQKSHKIMAIVFERDGEVLVDLKLTPAHGAFMRQYRGVSAGYHMNKVHWNTVNVTDTEISSTELKQMIAESDRLTQK